MTLFIICYSASNSSIIQLAAKHLKSGDEFNAYATPPEGQLKAEITALTGLEFNLGALYHNGIQVSSVSERRLLAQFFTWLEARSIEPVLAAHNVNFDARILVSSCDKYGIEIPSTLRFADTLSLFKKHSQMYQTLNRKL